MPAIDALQHRRTYALAAALAAAAGLGGCYYPGGPGYSADRFTYESTTWQPQTVILEDIRTGQEFWSVEVPVGQQLVVNFVEGEGLEDDFVPDLMQWQLMPIGQRYGGLENALPVPPAEARLLRPRLRRVPELPQDMVAAGGGRQPVRAIETPPPPPPSPAPAAAEPAPGE